MFEGAAPRAARDSWVVSLRGPRNPLDSRQPYAFHLEQERSASGEIVDVATVFLTNRECPWRCVMCDLWRNTLAEAVPPGAVPAQVRYALERLEPARHIKLYNSGSFFDVRAVPPGDDEAIAEAVKAFEHVVVESHPALVGERCFRLRDRLQGTLEVAMGLESADPAVLARLGKGVTLQGFARAAARLRKGGVALRVFVLLQPPWIAPGDALASALRSVRFAWECGATAVSLIATRGGNGAMEQLQAAGEWAPPRLELVEGTLTAALAGAQGRVFADTWDLAWAGDCSACASARVDRMRRINLAQAEEPAMCCEHCGTGA